MKKIYNLFLQSFFKKYAQKILGKNNLDIIGVTGSVGKSSTKEAIFQVLNDSQKFKNKVIKSEGNLNNELGLPLTILGFKESPKWFQIGSYLYKSSVKANSKEKNPLKDKTLLVLEYAADKPGDINYLTSIAKPKIGVITSVGEAHMEFFGNQEKIALEKSSLIKGMDNTKFAVINSDNDYTWRIGLISKANKIFFGTNDKANIRALDIKVNKDGTTFTLFFEGNKYPVKLKTIGFHQVYAALAAISVGHIYKLDIKEMVTSIENFNPPSGRDNLVKGIKNSLIIDSSYNANPTSMIAELETLKELKSKGRKIAVIGDMRELGSITEKSHNDIGEIASKIADKVIAVGEYSKNMKSTIWFPNSYKAAEFLKGNIQENDLILVKGSHAIKMEKIVDELKK